MKKEIYPEELTQKQTEKYPLYKIFLDGDTYKEDYEKAVKFAKKNNGEVYTMVNGENNQTYYLKGYHLVNRFGFCVLGIKEK